MRFSLKYNEKKVSAYKLFTTSSYSGMIAKLISLYELQIRKNKND